MATKKVLPVPTMGQDISKTDVILVDGKNTLWRGIMAQSGRLGYEEAGNFRQTGAVYGFLESVLAVAHKAPDADVYVCWEGSRKNRRAIVPEYKAHRDADKSRQELFKIVNAQTKILRGLLDHTSWIQARSSKWEADDAMSSLAASGRRNGLNVLICSNDKDMYQCLFESDPDNPDASEQWVRQYAVKKGVKPVQTAHRLKVETGLEPWQVPHMKGLAGDSSDGYKGVPGVGEGTASKWLVTHGDIEGVISACESRAITGKRAGDVITHQEAARSCYEVAIARADVPVSLRVATPDSRKLCHVLSGLRMHSLTKDRVISRLIA